VALALQLSGEVTPRKPLPCNRVTCITIGFAPSKRYLLFPYVLNHVNIRLA
jgi:hypothetical protein